MQTFRKKVLLGGVCVLSVLSGCATSTKDIRDPYEETNREVQAFNDKLDSYVLKPVAQGYKTVTPDVVDNGITNFFNNVEDIGVALNDLLQLKFKQGAQDSARFLVNTVAGVGGFVDVAKHLDLPKHDEDFDQTLGYWGVPTGPYLVLPFMGPNTLRGVGGKVGDAGMNPLNYIGYGAFPTGLSSFTESAISVGTSAVKTVDMRADLLSSEQVANEAALDRYDFFKNSYLQRRNYLVNDGKLPEETLDFDESDVDSPVKAPAKPGTAK